MDVTPLIGTPTGVGAFVRGAVDALADRADIELRRFGLTWRGRRGLRSVPAWLVTRTGGGPPIEWVTGNLDAVHGTNFVVPRARRAARVVTVHDLTPVRFPELCAPASRRYPALVRRAVGEGAWVHTPSELVAAEVREWLGTSRVRAVPHGVDAGLVSGPDAAPAGCPYVLALGTVEPRKDLPLLVRAFDRVAAGLKGVRLVIAGADGWGNAGEALRQAIECARHRDRIERRGYVPEGERHELVRGAAVFAAPSVYEGFGLGPLMAMACGVPVVATRAGALPEVVGEAGLLVEVGDEEGLAEALADVLSGARPELGALGRARARAFSWERCADGLVALYTEAAEAAACA